mmetsp:Transcript_47385/g.138152  ORF Transcript_47385/g.138152 Transcript_47385/m.138152 type:complete len:261 (-) Transcript_47385:148-930(-)
MTCTNCPSNCSRGPVCRSRAAARSALGAALLLLLAPLELTAGGGAELQAEPLATHCAIISESAQPWSEATSNVVSEALPRTLPLVSNSFATSGGSNGSRKMGAMYSGTWPQTMRSKSAAPMKTCVTESARSMPRKICSVEIWWPRSTYWDKRGPPPDEAPSPPSSARTPSPPGADSSFASAATPSARCFQSLLVTTRCSTSGCDSSWIDAAAALDEAAAVEEPACNCAAARSAISVAVPPTEPMMVISFPASLRTSVLRC